MKKVTKFIYFLVMPSILFSSANDAAVVFLTIFPGARAVGMGAAFTAVSDDATCTFYNPGGLPFIKSLEVSLQHSNWLTGLWPDMYYEFFGFVNPLGELGAIGGNVIYLTTGETEAYIEGSDAPIARFVNFDFAVTLNYGYRVFKDLGVGIGSKFIYSFLAPDWLVKRVFPESGGGGTGITYAFDFGLLYKLSFRPESKLLPGMSFGFSLLNFGPGIRYTRKGGGEDPLPRTLKVGVALPVYTSDAIKLTISSDITKILVKLFEDWEEKGFNYVWAEAWKHYGLEFTYYNFVSLRVGYFLDIEGARIGFMYGGGIRLGKFYFDIGVDSPIYDFETENYRFSLRYVF
ncbi:MAG: PorV/PorQ family protein [Candidatus Hydrothermales bacterium]